MKKALIKDSDPWMDKIENSNTLEITNITEPLDEPLDKLLDELLDEPLEHSGLMTSEYDTNLSLMESSFIEKPSEYIMEQEHIKEL